MKYSRILLTMAALTTSVVCTSVGRADDGGGRRTSSLGVSPTSLAFTGTVNGPVKSATLSVSASRQTSFTASASVPSGGRNWLTISPSGSLTTNRSITVTATPAGLTAGNYNGTVSLSSNGTTLRVPVTFSVSRSTPVTVTLSPTSLSFSATAGGASPAAQTVAASASASTSFTAASGSAWLTVSPASGTLTTTAQNLTVGVNQAGLGAGTYNGTISLTAAGSTRTVGVTLTVSAPAPITVTLSPTSLSFSATAGGIVPAAKTVAASASASTSFTAVSGSAWLTVSPASGTLTTTAQNLTVGVNQAGLAAGTYNGTISVTAAGSTRTVAASLTVSAPAPITVTLSPASLSFSATAGGASPAAQTATASASASTSFTASSGGSTWLTVSPTSGTLTTSAQNLTVGVNLGSLAAGTYNGTISLTAAGNTRTAAVSLTVSAAGPGPTGAVKVIGWNDLGMHCQDGKDFSVFSVLPPYNTFHAHVIDSTGKLVTPANGSAGYTLTYQAVTDPFTSTLNSTSAGKTNFWQYAASLFGMPGALAPEMGLKGFAMPGAGNTPQAMTFSTADNTWAAVGVPITPVADNGATNYLPMMRLVAKNAAGTVLGSTDIVLPVSDELSCGACHASNTGTTAAMPTAGWSTNADPVKALKLNILRKHDDHFRTNALFQSAATQVGYNPAGLETTSSAKPVLCAQCHGSNALSMAGVTGIPPLTTAVHTLHALVVDPATNQTMDSATTRDSCYRCHPGPATKCLRGAMGNQKTASGANAIECQSCHGSMNNVAVATRNGWLDEPNCQACHTGTATTNSGQIAYTSVFTSGTTVRIAADQTFATNPNTPAPGISLYRFSTGHGGLQCEACHGSTHAEYPSSNGNDNVQSTALQGHVGALAECSACHTTVPTTTNGGPHGLHPVGSTWVSRHQNVAGGNQASCQPCHGTHCRGTILSKTQADRSLAGHIFPRGTIIGWYSCHNGPNGD
ncbi:MAG: hypothetical protein LAP87_12405 [Acidobacteriia bacterium]|nr:hypothetical protein [Terriglobia bacterium]